MAPGVRVRVSSRGVRTSIGPRAARVHLGAGAPGFSTGVGPVSYYTSLGVGRRSTSGAVTRSVAASSRAEAAEQLVEVYSRIADLHKQEFPAVQRPLAPPPPAVLVEEIQKRHRKEAVKGISIFSFARRREARARAEHSALHEIAERHAQNAREQAEYQARIDQAWGALLANDPETVMGMLAAAFEDNDAAAAPLGVVDGEATLVVVVPAASQMPEKKPDVTPGGRPTIKALPKKEAADWHKFAVAGCILVTVKEAFAVAPALASVRIVATSVPERDAYGVRKPNVLVAARFERARLEGVQWQTVDSIRILNDTSSELRISQVGVTKALAPLSLDDEPALQSLVEAIDYDELDA